MKRILARRALWSLFVVYLFLSTMFLAFALIDDPTKPLGGEANTGRFGQIQDDSSPLTARYLTFMGWYANLDLGESVLYERSASTLVLDTLPVTLVYLVPAVLLAALSSLLTGLYTGMRPGGLADRATNALAQLGLGIPAVVVADLLAFWVGTTEWYPSFDGAAGLLSPTNLAVFSLPILVTAVNLWAVQNRAVRDETAAYLPQEFVRTLRAGGADNKRVARHLLRNAAPSLVALFVSEALATMIISMYVVEIAFGLPGFGALSYSAFFKPDLALVIPAVLLPVILGLAGNTAQDIVAMRLDPRIEG
ncbi:MAG: ABC transporter permease subunit [Halolamina sp.]